MAPAQVERSNPHVNLTAERRRRSIPIPLRGPAAGYVERWAHWMRSAIALVLWPLLVQVGHTADQVPRVTGFFSDMHYIEDAGDVLGTEIHLVAARGGYRAVIQCAEGGPGVPVVVPVKVSGQQIEFEIPDQDDNFCCPGKFRGTVSKDTLTGKFDSCDDKLILKRGRSYWR